MIGRLLSAETVGKATSRRSNSMVSPRRSKLSVLDEELTFGRAEGACRAVFRDQDRLGSFETPGVHPKRRHEVRHQARFKNCFVFAAERSGPLAPVGRVGQSDRIAHAAFAADAILCEDSHEGVGDVAGAVAGTGSLE